MQKKLQIANRKVTLMPKAQVVHTHQTSCRRGWPRRFGALNSSPHSRVFTFASVGSSPRSLITTCALARIGVHTKRVRYVTLHFLRHRNRAQVTVLVCEQIQQAHVNISIHSRRGPSRSVPGRVFPFKSFPGFAVVSPHRVSSALKSQRSLSNENGKKAIGLD